MVMSKLECKVQHSAAQNDQHTLDVERCLNALRYDGQGEAVVVELTQLHTTALSSRACERPRIATARAFPIHKVESVGSVDAIQQLQEWSQEARGDFVALCTTPTSGQMYLLCLTAPPLRTTISADSSILGHEFISKEADESALPTKGIHGWGINSRLTSRRRLLSMATLFMLFSIVTLALISLLLFPAKWRLETPSLLIPEHFQFPVPVHNVGPRHQKYLLPSNVTNFTISHNISEDFVLRLDDQALMPVSLVDHHERRVQAWFAETFPILAHVRDSGDFLEPSFLDFDGTSSAGGPRRIMISKQYHVAHCVTAWRRYLKALKSGRHVCPRDMDWHHLDHCTMQLEDLVYQSRAGWLGQSGDGIDVIADLADRFVEGGVEEPDIGYSQAMLVWHTDVCF